MPELADLLLAFRAVLPTASGVVLASPDGRALASDVPDADALAREAGSSRTSGESVLLPRPAGPVLVVFLPDITLFRPTTAAPA